MTEEQEIRIDRMRYTKNSLSSTLAILAIVMNVFYFVSIYKSNVGNFYYTYMMGISVVYNLIFMLAAFLGSEGVKNYKKNYSYALVVLGVIQIVRIFILPTRAHNATIVENEVERAVMGNGQFTWLVVLLVGSAVCLIASAAVNYMKCMALEQHEKTLKDAAA